MQKDNLIGNKYGRLTVLSVGNKTTYGRITWLCKCSCGKIKEIIGYLLKSGQTKSCGCLNIELSSKRLKNISSNRIIHGDTRRNKISSEYICWRAILRRCFYKKDKQYKDYGGRGITICEQWKGNYICFLKDMGRKPSLQHTIERINNNGNYEPDNCRWSTRKEQSINRRIRSDTKITLKDIPFIKTSSLSQRKIALIFKVSQPVIYKIKNNKIRGYYL